MCVYKRTHTRILLVLFLWSSQTNADFVPKVVLEEQNFKNEFSELVLEFQEMAPWSDLRPLMTLFPIAKRTVIVHGVIWQ